MSTAAAKEEQQPPPAMGGEEAAARAAQKRYEGLLTVRAKAVKGKGAWYWVHLEPVLVPPADTGMPPKAVKLRCALCSAVFSASNPSRTASEHLKRGTCPNFSAPPPGAAAASGSQQPQPQMLPSNSTASSPIPISSIAPSSPRHHHHHHHSNPHHHPQQQQQQQQHHHHSASRKRHSMTPAYAPADHHHHLVVVEPSSVYSPALPALPAPPQQQSTALVLSGGKEDLGALAMLEDSVKRLKSPKASPGAMMPKPQADAALALLADWFLESSGGVSLSAAAHPKLHAFLRQVGLPQLPRADLAGPRLDARFNEARADAAARVRDALFFQLAADGWRDQVVTLSVNLPNGTSVFHRAVPMPAPAPSDYAGELLLDAVASVSAAGSSSNDVHRCAGIVADRFKSKALRDLESKHHWMVNLSCQIHGFTRLVRDFSRELPIFRSAAARSAKLASYFNSKQTVRSLLHKYQIEELGNASLLRVAHVPFNGNGSNFRAAFEMLEDVWASAQSLRLAVSSEAYKLVCIDDLAAREMGDTVQSDDFWTEVEAVYSLVKLIMDMVKEMEVDRPLVGQCLPLWEELRSKVRDWCRQFKIDEGSALNAVEKRFRKNYHPAWSAAFILDPLYLVKDASNRYLPPFKCLTPDQEKDVDRLITRMVSREEAHLALMELMKWRSDGLDPLYAQAVQVRQPDPSTGKMKVANKQSSRLVWETCLSELKSLGKVAVRLIFLHATSRGFRCTPSMVRWLSAPGSLGGGIDRAQRLVFVAANSKLERKDFSSDEDKDAELLAEGEDDDEPGSVEASSV